MKKKVLSFILTFVCIISCGLMFTACLNNNHWEPPKRIALSMPENLHVEYTNHWLKGDALLPSYCVLVKEGNLYYVKAPTDYSSDRLEVMVKENLQNAQYDRSFISARWAYLEGGVEVWQTAPDDTNYDGWHANDHNGTVYFKGLGFLDSGYGDVNHTYENGVTDAYGYTYTSTQKENETLTLESGQEVECVVWEFNFTTSDTDTYSKEKFWFEKNTGITIQRSSITASSSNQSLDAEENIGLKATYFATNETMQSYLEKVGVDRWPAPDFSMYN